MTALLALLGLAGICLSLARHQRDAFGYTCPVPVSRMARWGGAALLLASFLVALSSGGLGLVHWFGIVGLEIPAIALALHFLRQPWR